MKLFIRCYNYRFAGISRLPHNCARCFKCTSSATRWCMSLQGSQLKIVLPTSMMQLTEFIKTGRTGTSFLLDCVCYAFLACACIFVCVIVFVQEYMKTERLSSLTLDLPSPEFKIRVDSRKERSIIFGRCLNAMSPSVVTHSRSEKVTATANLETTANKDQRTVSSKQAKRQHWQWPII